MRAKTARLPLRFGIQLTVEDVVETLASIGHDEVIEIIIRLDAACEDWDVTEKLHKHFTKEMVKLAEEDAKFGAGS
jgi:hypothetical protein